MPIEPHHADGWWAVVNSGGIILWNQYGLAIYEVQEYAEKEAREYNSMYAEGGYRAVPCQINLLG